MKQAHQIASPNTTTTATYLGPLRIKKAVGGGATIRYIYSGSKPIAEYVNGSTTPSKEYIYAGTQLLATIAGTSTTYHHPDHLSNRVETDSTGAPVRSFGHFPYGEVWYESASDSQKFTSYSRDSGTGESGLDYAMFRHYNAGQGRFVSVDMMAGAAWAPQSLNRFRYANNDPIDLIDPFGLDAIQFCWTHIERTDLNLGGTKVKGHERLITDRCEWLTFDFGNTPGDNWTVRLFGRSTVCSAARAKTNTMGIRVVRDNPHVKGEVTKVQGSAKANALKGEELTMGVTLLNDGSLIPQAASKDDPFGMSGPAPNVAYLQYGADAGATLNLNLTLTVQTINPLTGFNVDTPVSKDNISIDIRCFAKPDFTKE